MNDTDRNRFDALVASEIDRLPEPFASRAAEVQIIVMDAPDDELLAQLVDAGLIESTEVVDEVCGLHTGVALTERSVEDAPSMPDIIHLFRDAIVKTAGGWGSGGGAGVGSSVEEQIRITLLHELGHHMGLEEDDLDDLGYA